MSKLKNRGKEGRDDFLFQSKDQQRILKEAVKDMVHLLSRGYAEKSSLSLVGNRYRLNTRQQKAVRGMSASNTQLDYRRASHLESQQLKSELLKLEHELESLKIEKKSADYYITESKYIFDNWDTYTRDKKRELVEEVMDSIVIGTDSINFNLKCLLPRQNHFLKNGENGSQTDCLVFYHL